MGLAWILYSKRAPEKSNLPPSIFKMKTLGLILCFAVAAAVANPQYGNGCKAVKKIKYAEEYEQECHNEYRERCTYKTTYKEKCADEKRKVCEKVWTEDPSKCHWLQESECTQYPEPVKECHNVPEEVCTQIHKNVPQQHECEVCGGVEKSCRKLDTKYTKYEN